MYESALTHLVAASMALSLLKNVVVYCFYLIGAAIFIDDLATIYDFMRGSKELSSNLLLIILDLSNFFSNFSNFRELFLIGSFFTFFFSIIQALIFMSYLGLYGVFILLSVTLFIYWLSLALLFNKVLISGKTIHYILFKWFTLSSHVTVNFELYLDFISLSFALLTTTIAIFVILYAFCYFRYEPNIDRLIILLSSFVWSMTLLILSGNMFLLLLGWELIGLTSFLLIGFWATRAGTFKSAFKAFTFNKVSDAALILSIILLSLLFQDLTIPTIINETANFNVNFFVGPYEIRTLELLALAIITSASIKSAQIVGHLWLPDSMEAPVPASSLIHSATLVSAGIFLMLRLYPVLEHSWVFVHITPLIGAITAAYGGIVAAYQTDTKRLLAYSTISHCGFLTVLTTFGSPEYTIIYLYIHGFFKAISFMCIGNIIRFSKNYQDLRRMGNFWKFLPIETSLLTLALLNLSGAPFFWGFVCKHLIIASSTNMLFSTLTWSFILLGALMGPLYSYRLITHIFFDNIKSRKSILLGVSRKSFNSDEYSNTPIMGWASIILLTLFAYIIIFLLVYFLVSIDNMFVDANNLNMIDQSSQIHSSIKSFEFNMALFNWIGLFIWVSVVYTRWGNEYNSDLKVESFIFFLISFFFIFLFL